MFRAVAASNREQTECDREDRFARKRGVWGAPTAAGSIQQVAELKCKPQTANCKDARAKLP